VMVNELLELLRSVISSAEVPGFLTEMVCVAPVPIFTSPKSMETGVVTTVLLVLGENAFEFEPQPVNPVPIRMEQARIAIAPILYSGERVIDSEVALRADGSLHIKYEEVRVLLIRRHLSKVILVFRSADAESPAGFAAGITYRSCAG